MPDGAFPRAELLRGAWDPDALKALDQAGVPEAEPAAPAPSLARRGRGATTNPAVRYDRQQAEPFEDGWAPLDLFAELPPLPTTLTRDTSRRRSVGTAARTSASTGR